MLHFGVISVLPEMLDSINYGVTGRAIKQGLVKLNIYNPRDWSKGQYRQIDDRPYGGGPGMVMMYEPLHAAIQQARKEIPKTSKVIYLSPQGRTIHQSDLNQIVREQTSLIFVSGRYEGIDERVVLQDVDEEWSLGNYVLSGGELAAMVFIDALVRLIPGSLGHQGSAAQDSFMNGLLDFPHYTRPAIVDNKQVPEVLLTGDHQAIMRWQRKQALGRTWLKRPDLLTEVELDSQDLQLLSEFKNEQENAF